VKKRLDETGQMPTLVRLEQDLEFVRLGDLAVGHVTAREAGLIAMITESAEPYWCNLVTECRSSLRGGLFLFVREGRPYPRSCHAPSILTSVR
jgi:hypothetical protein